LLCPAGECPSLTSRSPPFLVAAEVGWTDRGRRRDFARPDGSWVKPLMLFQPCFFGGREDARTAAKSVAPSSVREPPEIFRPSSFSRRVRLDCWRWERPHPEGSARYPCALRAARKARKARKAREAREARADCVPFCAAPPLFVLSSWRIGARAANGWRRLGCGRLGRVVAHAGFWRGQLRQPRHMIAGQPLGGDAGALLGEAAEQRPMRDAPQTQPLSRMATGQVAACDPRPISTPRQPVSPLMPSRPRRPSARPDCRIARAGVCSNASPNSVPCLNFRGGQVFASMVCSGFRQRGNRLAVRNRRVGFDCEVQQLRGIARSGRCTPPEICLCGIAIGTRRSGSFLKRLAL
jgi:hypothetical protein